MWPNLERSELAPATAKRGEAKKVLSAASMVKVESRELGKRMWTRGASEGARGGNYVARRA